MLLRTSQVALLAILIAATHAQAPADQGWTQFRGPNATGIAAGDAPVEFGPQKNLLWRTPLPSGHSSPVMWGERIFLTGFDAKRKTLEVIAVNKTNGAIVWRHDVPAKELEPVHEISNPATATPVVDGERVYVYFASFGLLAYDLEGKEPWTLPLPHVEVPFGSGTSPIRAGDLIILDRHAPTSPFLLAVDRRSGTIKWRTPHQFPATVRGPRASHSTPVLAGHQIVVHGAGTVEGFDVATGKKEWWVTALSNGTSTPAVSGDVVYVSTWSALGESGDQWPTLPDFAAAVAQYDADHSGTLSEKELPADLYIFRRPETGGVPGADVSVRMMFGGFDSNDDGAIDAKEWAAGIEGWKGRRAEHGLIAVKTGGQGDVTASNVLWREKSSIPEVPSPLFYQDRVYLVRNGGIVSCLDAASGRTVYRARLGAPGPYYSSPIEAGGRVIVGSGDGTVVVFKAGDALDVLSRNDLGEPIFATPAVSNGVLYVRTASALSAFSQH